MQTPTIPITNERQDPIKVGVATQAVAKTGQNPEAISGVLLLREDGIGLKVTAPVIRAATSGSHIFSVTW
ncbi:MAG: hypothetical protein ABIZ56_03985 [Chthoniobacteraceae bacterium]